MDSSAKTDSSYLILQDDDPADPFASGDQEQTPWRILIVDDDVDVHVVTKFALSNTHFQGRRLSFLHAYNAKEALTMLRATTDIALVLLDVIMETDDAGLRLARQIRDELHNELVRIVLRTGQPGQALEHSIIVDYDINDFWCKADLTTRKLFTTVIASLRAYTTLAAAAAERTALNAVLAHARNVQATVDEHALVLTLDRHGLVIDANERLCRLTGATRADLIGRCAADLAGAPRDAALHATITGALAREAGWAGDVTFTGGDGAALILRCAVLAFKDDAAQTCQYVAVATVRD